MDNRGFKQAQREYAAWASSQRASPSWLQLGATVLGALASVWALAVLLLSLERAS